MKLKHKKKMEWLLATVLVLFFSYIMIWKRLSLDASGPNLPPGPSRLPIIGNLHQVISEPFHKFIWKMSQKYGPIILLHLGSQPIVIISSTELAAQAFETHDHVLSHRAHSRTQEKQMNYFTDIAFAPYDDHWKRMRKILLSGFLSSKMSKLNRKVLDMELKSVLDSIPYGTVVNLNELFINFEVDFTCKLVAGKSYRNVPIMGTTVKAMLEEMLDVFKGSFSLFFPKYGWILEDLSGWTRRLDKHIASFNGLLELMLDEHIENTSEDPKDLIDVCQSSVSRKEMKSLMSTVLNGTIDTSSLTLVWAMFEIIRNPRIMHKLQDEIRSHAGGKDRLDESDTAKMTYLKYVIKETLRIHGPLPILFNRTCESRIQIGGYDILPDTKVFISAWALARDPKIWTENANEFYPERFEKRVVEQFEMAPFGGGRRSCPGYNFATTTTEVVIANLFNKIDWKLPPGTTYQDLDDEEEGSIISAKKTPLLLVPVRHN